MAPIPGTGEFRPLRAGIAAARRQGAKEDRTPRFPVPSCDSPTFLWPLSGAFAAKKRGRLGCTLNPRFRKDV